MKILKILFLLILVSVFLIFLFSREYETYLRPLEANDTDGTPSEEIIQNMDNGFESVILKLYPFGYLEVYKWEDSGFLKKAFAIVDWKTYKEMGAGNIYIGYSFDGKKYYEVGPFKESDNVTETVIEVPVNLFSDLKKLIIRFRGEDLDYAADAIAEVRIRLKTIRYNWI